MAVLEAIVATCDEDGLIHGTFYDIVLRLYKEEDLA